MSGTEHIKDGEVRALTLKEQIAQQVQVVREKREAVEKAKQELQGAQSDFIELLKERLQGKKVIVTGRTDTEELFDQDGRGWFHHSSYLTNVEAEVTDVFAVKDGYPSQGPEDPVLYMRRLGPGHWGFSIYLSSTSELELIEEQAPANPSASTIGSAALQLPE